MFIKKEFFTQFKQKLWTFFHGEGSPEIHVGENNEITITGPKKVEAPVAQQKPEQVAENQPKNTAQAGENLANQFEGNVLQAEMTDIRPEDINRVLGIEPQKPEQSNNLETIEGKIDLKKVFQMIDDPQKKLKIEDTLTKLIQEDNTDTEKILSTIKLSKKGENEILISMTLEERKLGTQPNGSLIWNVKRGKAEFTLENRQGDVVFSTPGVPPMKTGEKKEEIKKTIMAISRFAITN